MASPEKSRSQQAAGGDVLLGRLATLENIEVPKFEVLTSEFLGGIRKRIMWAGGDDGFGRVEVYDLREDRAFIVPVDNREDAVKVFDRPLLHEEKGVPTEMLESYENFDGMAD